VHFGYHRHDWRPGVEISRLAEWGINERLTLQLRFLIEIDRLKLVIRGNRIADASRHENTAEHSWHLALFAMPARSKAWATRPWRTLLNADGASQVLGADSNRCGRDW